MADIIVRRIDDSVKARLKEHAIRHGRSLEAEARAILEQATAEPATPAAMTAKQRSEAGFGTLMHEKFRARGLTSAEYSRFQRAFDELRDRSEWRIPDFGE